MPPRAWRLRVQDIIDAIDAVDEFTSGLSLHEFEEDRRTVSAVLYQFGIIGEASAHVSEEIKSKHPEIGWRRLRETRNLVTHIYFGVDIPRLWGIIKRRLPAVQSQLRALLEAEGEDET